jgi:hypothetical protein
MNQDIYFYLICILKKIPIKILKSYYLNSIYFLFFNNVIHIIELEITGYLNFKLLTINIL